MQDPNKLLNNMSNSSLLKLRNEANKVGALWLTRLITPLLKETPKTKAFSNMSWHLH